MIGERWHNFKVLVDMLARFRTTHLMSDGVQSDLNCYSRIQRLAVDFHIFAEAPLCIWTEFARLEVLTICYFPLQRFRKRDGRNFQYRHKGLVVEDVREVDESTIYGKRAEWIRKVVLQALQTAKKASSRPWKLPKIRTVLLDIWNLGGINPWIGGWSRLDEDDDGAIEEASEESPAFVMPEKDKHWYGQATALMRQKPSEEKIQRIIARWHPLGEGADKYTDIQAFD